MRLLMESAPREHEKRTLSAHLECRGVCVRACSYLNPCMKKKLSHFVGPCIGKKEAILVSAVKVRITVKLRRLVLLIN